MTLDSDPTQSDSSNRPVKPADEDKPRRGRPPGSVSLTAEIQETIVRYLRAGAFENAAAEAAGISARTFHEWVERGRGEHPTRKSSPKLRAFARAVEKARGEARIAAEVRVHQVDPKFWLQHAARSKKDADGWTALPNEGTPDAHEELAQRIREADALENGQTQGEEGTRS